MSEGSVNAKPNGASAPSGFAFAGFRIIHNDGKRIGFEIIFPNEKMNKIKERFEGQPLVIQYYDGKIKVYSRMDHFKSIISALAVF